MIKQHPFSSLILPPRSARSLLPTRHGLMTTVAVRANLGVSRLMSNETQEEAHNSARHFAVHPQTSNSPTHYYIAAIILFGLLGNLTCIAAARRHHALKRSRFNPYLIACIVSDTVFLLCLGLVWLKGLDVNWHDISGVCTVSAFLSNTSSFLSAWYVAAIALELSTTLRNPYRIYRLFTTRRLLVKRVLLLALISLLANTWTLAMSRVVQIPVPRGPSPMGVELSDFVSHGNETDDEGPNESPTYVHVCHFNTEKEYVFRAFTIYEVLLSVAVPLIVTAVTGSIAAIRYVVDRFCTPIHQGQTEAVSNISPMSTNGTVLQNPNFVDHVQQLDVLTDAHERLKDSPFHSRLQDFTVHAEPEADRERRVLIAAVSTVTVGKLRPTLLNKRRPRHLMSPARYHAMLHRRTLERCLRLEASVRPLLHLKAATYFVSTLPHFAYRLSVIFGNGEGIQGSQALQPMIVIFLFYTQFALNAPLFAAYGCMLRLCNRKKP